jgi:hypothetical protein
MNPQQTISLKGDEPMAKKVNIQFVDDLDGESNADETITFALDNKEFEVDLSTEHAAELREAFAKYINVARRTGGSTRGGKRGGTSTGTSNREETQKIRAWAIDQKLPINPRGRISQDIQDQFYAVHGKAS